MEDEFTLQPGEEVIKRSDEVGIGKEGMFNGTGNSLILTNQSLVLITRGMFHKVKDVQRFPLSDIVVSNGQPQVKMGKMDLVTKTLDVYFQSGEMRFRFNFDDEIKDWIAEITEVITGQKVERKSEDEEFFGEIAAMADSVSHAVGSLKKAFGIKSKEMLSGTCSGCGASLTGHEGETVQCPYCGTYHTF